MSYLENVFSLSGKVCLVTGASRGIGHSLANAFHNAGAEVFCVGYVSFASVMLEDLVLGLNDVFQNLDVIYLEQDQLVKTLRIKSYADSIERLPSGLSKNIKAMSDWFIC